MIYIYKSIKKRFFFPIFLIFRRVVTLVDVYKLEQKISYNPFFTHPFLCIYILIKMFYIIYFIYYLYFLYKYKCIDLPLMSILMEQYKYSVIHNMTLNVIAYSDCILFQDSMHPGVICQFIPFMSATGQISSPRVRPLPFPISLFLFTYHPNSIRYLYQCPLRIFKYI